MTSLLRLNALRSNAGGSVAPTALGATLEDHFVGRSSVRYATEFFASLFPGRVVKTYVSALSELQDDLGWRNDVVVADELLKSLAEAKPEIATGAGFARGYFASRVAEDHDSMKTLWKTFKRLSPPSSSR